MAVFNRNQRQWIASVATGMACLAPSVMAVAGKSIPLAADQTVTAPVSPLAMHIHMVHLREVDLFEGKARARFEFHNAGAVPLKILQVKPSCGCVTTRMNQPPEGFAAGEAGEFYLEVDTAAESAGQHEYRVKIEYQLAGENSPAEWQEIVYRVDVPEKKVTVQPRAVIFYQLGKEPTTQVVRVTDFRGGEDFALLNVHEDSDFLTLEPPRSERDENGHRVWSFSLTAAGNVPSGQQTSVISIETNDSEFPQLRLPVLIYGPPKETAAK